MQEGDEMTASKPPSVPPASVPLAPEPAETPADRDALARIHKAVGAGLGIPEDVPLTSGELATAVERVMQAAAALPGLSLLSRDLS